MFPLLLFIKKLFITEQEGKKYPGPGFSFNLFILSRLHSCFYEEENDRNAGDNNTGKPKKGRQTYLSIGKTLCNHQKFHPSTCEHFLWK